MNCEEGMAELADLSLVKETEQAGGTIEFFTRTSLGGDDGLGFQVVDAGDVVVDVLAGEDLKTERTGRNLNKDLG